MTYFELFEIEPSYILNEADLKSKFIKLSRLHHPDRFVLESEGSQSLAEEKSALLNKAYRVLSDKNTRLKYLLELHEVIKPEEIYTLDQDFLMDMMDINDLIAADIDAAKSALDIREAILDTDIHALLTTYNSKTVSSQDLTLIKEYYYKKRYLWRLSENLKGNIQL